MAETGFLRSNRKVNDGKIHPQGKDRLNDIRSDPGGDHRPDDLADRPDQIALGIFSSYILARTDRSKCNGDLFFSQKKASRKGV